MKTFIQYITEVFDKPYKWSGGSVKKGSITPENDGVPEDYRFKTSDGGKIELTANHHWIEWDRQMAGLKIKEVGHTIAIEFVKNDSYEMTGEGDAMRIMATVLDIIKSIIKKHKPMTITFSADKKEFVGSKEKKTGRVGAYGAIVKRFAGTMGYKSDAKDTGRSISWQLTKK